MARTHSPQSYESVCARYAQAGLPGIAALLAAENELEDMSPLVHMVGVLDGFGAATLAPYLVEPPTRDERWSVDILDALAKNLGGISRAELMALDRYCAECAANMRAMLGTPLAA